MTLNDLKKYLNSDNNEHGVDSIATHGFLVATIVGPPLPNWLSVLFAGDDHEVNDDIKVALKVWREEIVAILEKYQRIDLPFEIDEDYTKMDFSPSSEIAAWSTGFVEAMFGNRKVDWFEVELEDTQNDVATLTFPMFLFTGMDIDEDDEDDEEEEDEAFAIIRSDEESLMEMANSIEGNLTELYLLFHTQE